MKLLGSLKELVKIVFRTPNGKEVEMQPAEQAAASPVTIQIPDVGVGGSDTVVMESADGTLSNKTIDNSNDIDAEAIADGSVTNAEFQYLSGVTSDIQTQIDSKEPTITTLPVSQGGTGSSSALTNDKAMISSGDAIVESSVTSTELGHLSGVSSSVQTQLDGKAENGANSDITSLSGLTTALSISQGGTGETTANDALNALLPSQSGNLNKFLRTDGTNVEWAAAGGGSGINYLSDIFDADVSPTTTSVAAISTTNTDYSNFLVSSAGGTLSQDTASSVRGANSYKFVPSASGEFFGLPAFQLAEVDLGKALSIKFDLKNDGAAADWDVVVCRYNSSGVHQETVVVAGTASAGTPASAQLPTGLTSFRGFFITGSDKTDYYRLFVRHLTSATDAVYLDTLVVGPEAVMEGAIVTDWEEYTPTFSASFGTTTLRYAKYRRVGSSVEIIGRFLTGTVTTGIPTVTIPSGLTANVSTTSYLGDWRQGGSSTDSFCSGSFQVATAATLLSFCDDFTTLSSSGSPTSGANASILFRSNSEVGFQITLPVNEWSSNTVMASRTVEEYAYNTSSGTGSDPTSFGYGPDGVAVASFAPVGQANVAKRVRFQTPILSTDILTVEFYDGNIWRTLGNTIFGFSTNDAGSTFYGVQIVGVNSTDVDVRFYSAAAPGIAWSTVTSSKWRVRKVSGGAAVGFPVSARNVIGDTSGTAVPAGYVGETLTVTGSLAATTTAYATGATLTLTDGVWLFSASGFVSGAAGFTGLQSRLNIKGAASYAAPYTDLKQSCPSGGYAITSFPTQTVVVASGDADKTIKFDAATLGANSTVNIYISATRIA